MGSSEPPTAEPPPAEDDSGNGSNSGSGGRSAAAPPAPLFRYSLLGSNVSLPALALFVQRQAAAQELQLFNARAGVQIGYVPLAGTTSKPQNGAPLVIAWRGTYVDHASQRELSASSGDYYFVVRMRRPSAAADLAGTATAAVTWPPVDVWTSPVFRLTMRNNR